jgi:hypothetical protein
MKQTKEQIMNEKELREMYFAAMIDLTGSAPASTIERPLSPIMIKFAEMIVRKAAQVADEADSYQTYNLSGEICEAFGLTS